MENEKIHKALSDLVEELLRQNYSLYECLGVSAVFAAAMVEFVAKSSGSDVMQIYIIFINKFYPLICNAFNREEKGGEG